MQIFRRHFLLWNFLGLLISNLFWHPFFIFSMQPRAPLSYAHHSLCCSKVWWVLNAGPGRWFYLAYQINLLQRWLFCQYSPVHPSDWFVSARFPLLDDFLWMPFRAIINTIRKCAQPSIDNLVVKLKFSEVITFFLIFTCTLVHWSYYHPPNWFCYR